MILAWAASILGFSLERTLITQALRLLKFNSPTQLMNYLKKDPISMIKKMGSLPFRERLAFEKRIESIIKQKYQGAVKLKIDFKKLSKQLDGNKKLIDEILKWNDNNVKIKKNNVVDINEEAVANLDKNIRETERLETEVGEFVKMSSSWITGAKITGIIDDEQVRADVYINGKAYDFVLKKSTWNRMVSAIGSHGTGAGSVIWDTEFRYKRKLVRKTREKYQ